MFKEVKRIFKDTVVYGMGSLLPKVAGIVLVPIYTRYLAPAEYGVISLAMMITTLVSSIMLLGQQGSLTRYLRMLEREGQHEDAGRMLFSAVIFTLVAASAILGVLLLIGPWATPFVVNQKAFTYDPFMRIALLTAFLTLPFGMLQAVNRSRGQSVMHTVFQLSNFVLNTGITIIFVVVLRQGAYGSLKGNFGAALILAPITLFVLARSMKAEFSLEWLKKSLAFGLPLIPHFLAGWMLTFSDRWMIGHFRTMEEVGLYSLAYNLSMIFNMFVSAINTSWGPVYYDLAATEEGRAKLPRLTTIFATSVTILGIGYLLFSREALLLLASARYHEAAPLVPIIVAGYFGFAMYAVLSTPIFFARKTKIIPLISGLAAAVNISLNWLLVPKYGMWAAAWMTLVAYGLMAVIARIISGRLFPGSFEDIRILKLVLVFVMAFAGNWLVNSADLGIWLSIALKLSVFVLAAGAMLWLDIITVTEAKKLIDKVGKRFKPVRTLEQEQELIAAEQTVEGAMSNDSGFNG